VARLDQGVEPLQEYCWGHRGSAAGPACGSS